MTAVTSMSWLEQRREVQLALNAALAVRSPRSSAERLHFLGQFLLDWHGGKRHAGTAAVISSSQPAASATEVAELELAIKRALIMAKRNTSELAIVVVARHLIAQAGLRPAHAAALAPSLPGASLKPVPLPDCEDSIGFVSYSEGWSEHWPFVSYGEGAFDTRSPELKAACPLIKCVAAPIADSSSSSSSSSSSNSSSSAAPHAASPRGKQAPTPRDESRVGSRDKRAASPRGKRAPSPRGPKGGAASAAADATSHAAKGHVSARQQLPAIDIAAAHLAAAAASDAPLRPPPADAAAPGTALTIKGKYGEVHDVQLSKLMSKLLRHKAKEHDVPIDTDGWVLLTDAIAHVNRREAELALESEPPREPCTWTEEHVHAMVGLNDKQRFELREQTTAGGVYQIRATQGHSMKQVGEQIGTLIAFDSETKEASVPFAVHGTTITALGQILAQGLHKMERHHIHLAKGLLGEEAVISGMRHDCAVYIWVDISRALEHGIRFFESTNGVILCEGDENGYLPPRFFSSVIELRGMLAQPNYAKQPLVRLLERLFPGRAHVTATKLHGGFSGSLVLQTDSRDMQGRPNEPTVTKFDYADSMIEEVRRTEEISQLVGAEAIKLIRGPEFVDSKGRDMALGTARETATARTARSAASARALASAIGTPSRGAVDESIGYGAVVLEMAGACWVLPEFFGKLEVELLATFKKRLIREMHQKVPEEAARSRPSLPKLESSASFELRRGASHVSFKAALGPQTIKWEREAMDVLNDLWGHGGALANLAMKTVQRDLYNAVAPDGLIATQLRATAKAMVIVFDKPPAGSAIWVQDERAREYEPPSNVQAALAQLQQKRIVDVKSVAKRDKFAASFVLDVPSHVWSDANCQPLISLLHQLEVISSGTGGDDVAWLAEWQPLRLYQHGDLNAANVLVDVKDRLWLIDFAKAGVNLPFHDAAKMVSVLLFEYYPIPLSIDEVHAVSSRQLEDRLGIKEDVANRLKFKVVAPADEYSSFKSRASRTSKEHSEEEHSRRNRLGSLSARGGPLTAAHSQDSSSFEKRKSKLRSRSELHAACMEDGDARLLQLLEDGMVHDAAVCERRMAEACEIVDRLLWGSDKMPLDSQLPEPPPEPLELWEMFDQVAPSSWAEHQRMTFDLTARVLKLAFQLVSKCSHRSRSDDPTEAHAAVEPADLHACNFLFVMLHRSLSSLRYVDLSTYKKRVAWHTVRRCADALRTVLARRPRLPPMVAASFTSTLMLAEGAPMLLRPSASTDDHEDGAAAAERSAERLVVGSRLGPKTIGVIGVIAPELVVQPLSFDIFSQLVG